MSIPGVKGVEIGSGFESAVMRGSEHNDIFVSSKLKTVASRREQSSKPQLKTKNLLLTLTNYSGGILGGISNGMPIVARIAVKPTSSIAQEQMTINEQGQLQKIKITGRHDPCICPRVVPVAEAMMALVLVDSYFISRLSRL
jgi:chorismate synthase